MIFAIWSQTITLFLLKHAIQIISNLTMVLNPEKRGGIARGLWNTLPVILTLGV